MAPGRPPAAGAASAYVAELTGLCDALVLPLGGSSDGVALAIAREVHRQRAGFRTILFTGSFTATAATASPLFDYVVSIRSRELPAVLDRALSIDAPPRQDRDTIDRQIAGLIRQEVCFQHLRTDVVQLTPCSLSGGRLGLQV